MFEIFTELGPLGVFLLLIIFILFIISIKRVLSIIKNAIIIAIASILFPVILSVFFNYPISMDSNTIMSFLFVGLAIYFLYLVAKTLYAFFKIAEKVGKAATAPIRGMKTRQKKKFEKRVEKHIKESEEVDSDEEERYSPSKPIIVGKKDEEKTYYDNYTEIEDPDKRRHKKEEKNFAEPLPEIKPRKKK